MEQTARLLQRKTLPPGEFQVFRYSRKPGGLVMSELTSRCLMLSGAHVRGFAGRCVPCLAQRLVTLPDLGGVTAAGGGAPLCRTGVIGTDGIPRIAQAADHIGQDGRADMDRGTRLVQQSPRIDATLFQPWQMDAVDLHYPIIDGAVAIVIDGSGLHARLHLGDRVQQQGIDSVTRPRRLEALRRELVREYRRGGYRLGAMPSDPGSRTEQKC